MTKFIVLVAALILLAGCAEKPPGVKAKSDKDSKVAAVEERISKNTPEAKQIIEKVQAMKPEVNGQLSGKTLSEMVDEYAKNKGAAYNITPIGWEASKKKLLPGEKSGRWKVVFDYQDYQKTLVAAEWEYNAETNKLYPFEEKNAPFFYSEAAPPAKKGKK
jgi:hypothetical protein